MAAGGIVDVIPPRPPVPAPVPAPVPGPVPCPAPEARVLSAGGAVVVRGMFVDALLLVELPDAGAGSGGAALGGVGRAMPSP